jgi:glucosamine-6-phosphate deaminase
MTYRDSPPVARSICPLSPHPATRWVVRASEVLLISRSSPAGEAALPRAHSTIERDVRRGRANRLGIRVAESVEPPLSLSIRPSAKNGGAPGGGAGELNFPIPFPRLSVAKSGANMNVLHFDSGASWLAGVVTSWRDRLRLNPTLRQCIASGNTPIPIYRQMVQSVRLGHVSFAQAVIFALDEFGGLAPDDPGRCKNMLWRDLVAQADLPQDNFNYLDPDVPDLAAECRRYDAAIGTGFDLVLLGIGPNGHLGMNEPGSAVDSPTRREDLHPSTVTASARYLTHQRLPEWGLTVGMAQLFASKEVWLVVTGQAKAEIVERILQGEISTDVPASLMRRHPNCSLFLDAAAGSSLAKSANRA